jgi:UDP-N-acetylmuramoylalanine--D-glutamate ligase
MKRDFKEFKDFIKGKKTAVVGIGVSNRPLINFLLELNAQITAFDKKEEKELGEIASQLKNKGVRLELGMNYFEKLHGFDVIFKTPSMRIDSPALLHAKQENTYITSEMEEFVKYCPAKIYGITGSDGKTTTTTIIYNILSEQGYKTWVGGNIGTPLFSSIEKIKKSDRVVLELSSFQLMTMTVSPEIALITNLSPNHLDMHKSLEEYLEAKKNIYKYQFPEDTLVLNEDNEITNSLDCEALCKVIKFSRKNKILEGAYYSNGILYVYGKEVCKLNEIKLMGMHNVENFLAAFASVYDDASIESMRKTAVSFTGVEHRCEFVREIEGIKYYNDSIASSPTRTLAGLKAFDQKVILIAGGYDKKLSFEILAKEGISKIKVLILVGNTKFKIKKAFDDVIKQTKIELPIIVSDTFEEAVIKANQIASKGDIVTLSPACASFDLFSNFEVRGNKFKELVNNL